MLILLTFTIRTKFTHCILPSQGSIRYFFSHDTIKQASNAGGTKEAELSHSRRRSHADPHTHRREREDKGRFTPCPRPPSRRRRSSTTSPTSPATAYVINHHHHSLHGTWEVEESNIHALYMALSLIRMAMVITTAVARWSSMWPRCRWPWTPCSRALPFEPLLLLRLTVCAASNNVCMAFIAFVYICVLLL